MIQLPEFTNADYKQKKDRDRRKAISADRSKIDAALEENNADELRKLHRYLDSKYGASITGWGMSMYGYSADQGFDYNALGQDALRDNLCAMQAKLEAFAEGWNIAAIGKKFEDHSTDVNVTVENSVQINITFEQVRSQVEDMTSLTDEQTREILDKINEIEKVVNSTEKKKTKWEKLKPTLTWLADKSCDVGIALLPLLLKI